MFGTFTSHMGSFSFRISKGPFTSSGCIVSVSNNLPLFPPPIRTRTSFPLHLSLLFCLADFRPRITCTFLQVHFVHVWLILVYYVLGWVFFCVCVYGEWILATKVQCYPRISDLFQYLFVWLSSFFLCCCWLCLVLV